MVQKPRLDFLSTAITSPSDAPEYTFVFRNHDATVRLDADDEISRSCKLVTPLSLERDFDAAFTTRLALKEKQIQQSYRPVIGIHKWFARRPGTVFRSLLIAEFGEEEPLAEAYWKGHQLRGCIGDPFIGGGTPVFEANRLGFHVVGTDINPMAYWVVRQSLSPLDLPAFEEAAAQLVEEAGAEIGDLYQTKCLKCSKQAQVKYFIWVKTSDCPSCGTSNDLFPGYLLSEDERHPFNVVACAGCGHLNEYTDVPTLAAPAECGECGHRVHVEGNAKRQHVDCRKCCDNFAFKGSGLKTPLRHRLWAMEYHCLSCKPDHEGRFFKSPDKADLDRVKRAQKRLADSPDLPIPDDEIPAGDESDRLHRWGFTRYREMFNDRQLLGLGLLLRRIMAVESEPIRHALLTVFSDSLRYQNMLCRYDTYALKCQDIFSVHGFPVGLVQCENNLLGIAGVGSGSFRHFVEKYLRAKQYCEAPFETRQDGKKKVTVPIEGERIAARLVDCFPKGQSPEAFVIAAPAATIPLPVASLDGVFTDPPYYDNVQYAELMDFCFVWLRIGLKAAIPVFERGSTRSPNELTGNDTLGRGMEHFTDGLSCVFRHFAAALKPNAPFVFTYHHNDPTAYLPLVVAILDAGLNCTATLPAAAEMSASLHIAGTGSSILDSVFVCRAFRRPKRREQQGALALGIGRELRDALDADAAVMSLAGLTVSAGDLRCLAAGHAARMVINHLAPMWECDKPLEERMATAKRLLEQAARELDQTSGVNRSSNSRAPSKGGEHVASV